MRAGVHQVTTFARHPFHGNPAFVLSIDGAVDDRTLQGAAAQLGEAILPALRQLGPGRAEIRFHTPTGMHGGAGHSLLAAAHVQLCCGGRAAERATLVFADGSERVIRREGERIVVPWPAMAFSDIEIADPLCAALGARAARTLDSAFGYVAIFEAAETVAGLRPDLDAVGRLDRDTVIVTAPGVESDIVIRVFAPKLGLPEDPVCGTAHRIVAPYWAGRLGLQAIHSRQLSRRGGDLWCRLDGDSVLIAGESAVFLEGSVNLPHAA
jgi:predicted PhzF superfamily epimerase YddE/YHI9